jgi:hypothetical protein
VKPQDTLLSAVPLRSSWTIVSSSHWLLKLTPRRHRIHSLPGSHSGGTFCCSRHWQWLGLDDG